MEAFDSPVLLKGLGTLAILAGLYVLRHFLLWGIDRRVELEDTRYFWRQITGYIALLLAVLLVSRLWFQQISGVLTVLSLIAAALTIVSKELILNFLAWPIITWRRLFGIGDRVRVGEQAGDVVDMGILYFTLAEISPVRDDPEAPADQHTGRVVKLPNSLTITQPVVNYSRSVEHLWNRLDVALTPESRWQKAEEIAQRIAAQHQTELSPAARRRLQQTNERSVYAEPSPSTTTTVRGGHLMLTIRYLCRPRKRHATEQAIWRELLEAFAQDEGVQIAFSSK